MTRNTRSCSRKFGQRSINELNPTLFRAPTYLLLDGHKPIALGESIRIHRAFEFFVAQIQRQAPQLPDVLSGFSSRGIVETRSGILHLRDPFFLELIHS